MSISCLESLFGWIRLQYFSTKMQEFMWQSTAYKNKIFWRSFLIFENTYHNFTKNTRLVNVLLGLLTKFGKKVKSIPKFLSFLSLDFFGQFPFMFKPKFRFAIDAGLWKVVALHLSLCKTINSKISFQEAAVWHWALLHI